MSTSGDRNTTATATAAAHVRLPRWLLRLAVTCAAVASLSIAGCQQGFQKIPPGELDPARKANAEKIGTDMLTGWARDEYKPLGEEAREEMQKAHTPASQKAADKQLEQEIGDFMSMTFAEAQRSTGDQKLELYRFKGTFSKSKVASEVRVVFDDNGKLAGFWIKPWKDSL